MNDIGLYTREQVIDLTTLTRSTLYRHVKSGDFPAPVTLSRGRVAWPRHLVHEWLRQHGAVPEARVAA